MSEGFLESFQVKVKGKAIIIDVSSDLEGEGRASEATLIRESADAVFENLEPRGLT